MKSHCQDLVTSNVYCASCLFGFRSRITLTFGHFQRHSFGILSKTSFSTRQSCLIKTRVLLQIKASVLCLGMHIATHKRRTDIGRLGGSTAASAHFEIHTRLKSRQTVISSTQESASPKPSANQVGTVNVELQETVQAGAPLSPPKGSFAF
jgi:hypothetical protein